METPNIQTAQSQPRIVELDALRGLAVIGIVWMNVYAFALPLQAYYNPIAYGGEGQFDRLIWAASFVFIEDKFRTLFALLFGAGCLILLERAKERAWRAHFARMAVLFAIGLVHSILLASNDVLRAYALAGLAIPFLAYLSSRALIAISLGLLGIHLGGGMVAFGSGVVDFYAGRMASDASLFAERNYGSDSAALRYTLGLGAEDLGERVIRRSGNIPAQLQAIALSIPLNLAAMSLGMALWKNRLLAGEWRVFKLQRVSAIAALFALPGLLMLAWWVAENGFPGGLVGAAALVVSAPFDMALGFAYAALAMALFAAGGPVTDRLASVGRLSLSNYLMTSIILASIFASWGLGLFGSVSRLGAFAFSFVPIGVMLLISPYWHKHVGQGPFERLWRGLSSTLN